MINASLPVCCADPSICCSSASSLRTLDIEVLYLDDAVCDRCQNTLLALDEAIDLLRPVFNVLGVYFSVRKIKVTTVEMAMQNRLLSSPTLRINRMDVEDSLTQSLCESCGDLCGEQTLCRTFTYRSMTTPDIPVGLVVEAILHELMCPRPFRTPSAYQLPENLSRFLSVMSTKNP